MDHKKLVAGLIALITIIGVAGCERQEPAGGGPTDDQTMERGGGDTSGTRPSDSGAAGGSGTMGAPGDTTGGGATNGGGTSNP